MKIETEVESKQVNCEKNYLLNQWNKHKQWNK